jgi:hypothetical protein
MVGVSGKAMQGTVPPARTDCQEAKRGIESEGHKSVRPLLTLDEALATPNIRNNVIGITAVCNTQIHRYLRLVLLPGFETGRLNARALQVQNNAHSLHEHAEEQKNTRSRFATGISKRELCA